MRCRHDRLRAIHADEIIASRAAGMRSACLDCLALFQTLPDTRSTPAPLMPPAAPSCPSCKAIAPRFVCVKRRDDGTPTCWGVALDDGGEYGEGWSRCPDSYHLDTPAAPEGVVPTPLWHLTGHDLDVYCDNNDAGGEEMRALPVAAYAALVKSNEDARALIDSLRERLALAYMANGDVTDPRFGVPSVRADELFDGKERAGSFGIPRPLTKEEIATAIATAHLESR